MKSKNADVRSGKVEKCRLFVPAFTSLNLFNQIRRYKMVVLGKIRTFAAGLKKDIKQRKLRHGYGVNFS